MESLFTHSRSDEVYDAAPDPSPMLESLEQQIECNMWYKAAAFAHGKGLALVPDLTRLRRRLKHLAKREDWSA